MGFLFKKFVFFIDTNFLLLVCLPATASAGLQPEQFNQEKQRAGVTHGKADPDLSTSRGESLMFSSDNTNSDNIQHAPKECLLFKIVKSKKNISILRHFILM